MQGTILCMFGRKTERQHVLNGIYLYRSKRHVACFLSFSLFFYSLCFSSHAWNTHTIEEQNLYHMFISLNPSFNSVSIVRSVRWLFAWPPLTEKRIIPCECRTCESELLFWLHQWMLLLLFFFLFSPYILFSLLYIFEVQMLLDESGKRDKHALDILLCKM